MFYRYRRKLQIRDFDRAIAGIMDTPPLKIVDAPWSVVSMVATHDVPMYLLALKSFYRAMRRGKVVAIIDRDMPEKARDVLRRHVEGIEFVILEDIPTGECQRGGTWERILHIVDRTESEYTIQMDSDILTVADRLDEVAYCCEHNIPFTLADGFFNLLSMPEAARIAEATPGNYIGLITERAFGRYPGAASQHYIRGSSGFAGFCKGGVTRAELTVFHKNLEALVGKEKFREWGSEQCASNWVVANSPNAVVLPYPDYATFGWPIPLEQVKLFHFTGRVRFRGGYYAGRGREVIAKLLGRAAPKPVVAPAPIWEPSVAGLSLGSTLKYALWRATGQSTALAVRLKNNLRFELRDAQDQKDAAGIFTDHDLKSPVWIARERIHHIVDLGAGAGFSTLYWLMNFPEASIVAFEPKPETRAQCARNLAMNADGSRVQVMQSTAIGDVLDSLAGQTIDILRLDAEAVGLELLDDARFAALKIGALVLALGQSNSAVQDRAVARLTALGYRPQPPIRQGGHATLWGFRATFPSTAT